MNNKVLIESSYRYFNLKVYIRYILTILNLTEPEPEPEVVKEEVKPEPPKAEEKKDKKDVKKGGKKK